LVALPGEIGNLRKLRQLHLRFNKLLSIPDSVTGLAELEILSLRANKLTKLPAQLGRLESLRQLGMIWSLRFMSRCLLYELFSSLCCFFLT
jgi:Leucine-rich repeat (LRR) protein